MKRQLRTLPTAETQAHENLASMHRVLVNVMCQRQDLHLSAADAVTWADAILRALQGEFGGRRLGRKDLYIPVPDAATARNERIRALMGDPPHSRVRAREVANKEQCSVATVWRAVRIVTVESTQTIATP